MKYLAKSKEKNNGNEISLMSHLIEVANKCAEDAKKHTSEEEMIVSAYITGFAHDIGKVTSDFQNHIKNNTEFEYDHSYVSAYLLKKFVSFNINLNEYKDAIICSVLNHHPNIRMENNVNIDDTIITDEVLSFVEEWVNFYNKTEYGINYPLRFVNNNDDDWTVSGLDSYWSTEDKFNRKLLFLSSVLRNSDILVSNKKLNETYLTSFRQYDSKELIKPLHYDDRFYEQKELALKAKDNNFSMIVALAGWGKTMAGLIYLLSGNKKGYWICPRLEITNGIYKGVCNELKALGLYNNVSIAKMVTGKYTESNDENLSEYQNGTMIPDITIINIDSFLRPLFNTDSNIRVSSFINSNCIFDEFHEYFTSDAILALYNTIMMCRKIYCNDVNTLLLSASEEFHLYHRFINDNNIYYGHCDNMRNSKIEINFSDNLEDIKGIDHIIFTKSVKSCQNIKISELVDNIVHARYVKSDKEAHMNKVYTQHGKVSNDRNNSWVSTDVIGTGLDLTFNNMTICYPSPNDSLQKPGRLNRHNNMSDVKLIFVQPESLKKSETSVININYDKSLQESYYLYLRKSLSPGIHTKGELYDITNNFKEIHRDEYKKMYNKFHRESLENLAKIDYCYSNTSNDKNVTFISNKNSIRSNEPNKIFILIPGSKDMSEPMQIDLNDGFITEEYLRRNIDETETLIRKYDKNHVYYRSKQHMEASFRGNNIFNVLKRKALCSDTPFLLSNEDFTYTKELGLYKK